MCVERLDYYGLNHYLRYSTVKFVIMENNNKKRGPGRPRKMVIKTPKKRGRPKKEPKLPEVTSEILRDPNEIPDKYKLYWEEMPNEVKESPDKIKDLYLAWYKLGEEVINHPLKTIVVNGKTIDVSGNPVNIKNSLKKFCADEKTYEEAMKNHSILKKLLYQKRIAKIKLNTALSKQNGNKHNPILVYRQTDVLNLFGQWKDVDAVHYIITRDWKLGVTKKELREFQEVNAEVITHLRNKYAMKKKEFTIATETGRLESLSKLHHIFTQKFEKTPTTDISREIRGILDSVRKEVKGDEIKLTVDGKINIQATQVANKTIDQILSRLPLNLFIIGIVAARGGINPAEIIASLTNSYYSKYNAFGPLDNAPQAPSVQKHIQAYDWEQLSATIVEQKPPQTMQDYENSIEDVQCEIISDKKESALDIINKFKTSYRPIGG